MKQILAAIAFLGIAVAPAIAVGPNANGTLVVHDSGIIYTTVTDLPIPPASTPPTSCAEIDSNAPAGSPTDQTVWKVYAAFPDGSSPRLKGLAWGITGTGSLYVTIGGLPDPPNCFQVVSGSWPSPPGSIGQSFVYTQTNQLVECYWFGGYGYQGAVFSTGPHDLNDTAFVDDATPGNLDAIAGFSTIGFGTDGTTICPVPPPPGACCYPDYSCAMAPEFECTGTFYGGECVPNPCPLPPTGACCVVYGDCQELTYEECTALGGYNWLEGYPCDPMLCIVASEQTTWGRIKATYR